MRASLRLTIVAAICAIAALFPTAASAFGPVSSFGTLGVGAGQLGTPRGIAIAADGTTYVGDYELARVSVFDRNGGFLFAFGSDVEAGPGGGDICTTATGCQMGTESGSAGALTHAGAPEIGPDGNLYIPESNNNRIDVFSPQGGFLYAFGRRVNPDGSDLCTLASGCQAGVLAAGAGAFNSPEGLSFGPDGNLYVADETNNRIDVFTPRGTFLRAFGKGVDLAGGGDICTVVCRAGKVGGGAGELNRVTDVAVSPDGTVYATEEESNRVEAFGLGGEFRFAIGGAVNVVDGSGVCTAASGCRSGTADVFAGALADPTAVALGPAGNLFVAELTNKRVSAFNPAGAFQRAFGAGVVKGSMTEGIFEICDLATGCEGGESIPSRPPGNIELPYGVAFDCHGALYVAESGAFHRVERFAEPGTPAGPCPKVAGPPPSNRIKVGKLRRNLRKGTATLLVTVPGPGQLTMSGRGLKKVSKAVAKAGKVKLPVRLLGAAKRKLARSGKAKVKAKLSFTPTGGTAASQVKALVLKRKARHARRAGG